MSTDRDWTPPTPDWPSDHLRIDTWPARADPDAGVADVEGIRAAWRRGKRLNMAHAPHGHARVPDHDEARFDAETLTVLFRRGDTLVTCYSVAEVAITNDHGEAVRQAVEAQFGEISDSDMRFTEDDS